MEQRTVGGSRLYDADGLLFDFDATVVSCEPADDRYAVVLDQTAFFPGGGGQPCDEGTLGGVRLLEVKEKDGAVLHFLPEPLPVGATVHGALDRITRTRRMQAHGGEHILSGLLHSLYGAENVGFRIGAGQIVTVDTDIPLDAEQLKAAEREANLRIAENRAIRVYYPTPEALAALAYRSKLDLTEGVRIVEVDGTDRCACCAPHFPSTAPIGVLKILDTLAWHGGTRLFLACGLAAYEDYAEKLAAVRAVSVALSAKPEAVCEAVLALKKREEELKTTAAALRRALRDANTAGLPEKASGNLVIFDDLSDAEGLRDYANRLAACCDGIAAALAATPTGFTYAAASKHYDMKKNGLALNAALGGKGGGSPQMIFGNVSADRATVENWLAAYKPE